MLPGVIELYADAGLPPWPDIYDQPSIRYATLSFALSMCKGQWLPRLVTQMVEGLDTPLIDIRYWHHLNLGELPGPDNWHVDDLRKGGGGHRLYCAGADSTTEFWPARPVPEGWIVGYRHYHVHRVRPAARAGPRLFLRVSESDRTPLNRVVPPPRLPP